MATVTSGVATGDSGGGGNSRLRVLHVIATLRLGGSQNLLKRVVAESMRRDLDVRVCVLEGAEKVDEAYKDLQATPLNFHGDYRRPFALRSCVSRLQEVLEQERPDVVHSYLWTADLVTALAVRGRQIPHVSHILDRRSWQESPLLVHRLRRMATRWSFQQAKTRFVAVSAAACDYAGHHLKLPAGRSRVAYNGIDWGEFVSVERIEPQPNGPLILGTAGRLETEKGHRFLIDAVKRLLDSGRSVLLEITGDGSLRDQLEVQVGSLGIGERVRFLGWVRDVREFYRGVDVFVAPSIDAEGLPTTILEAMASGCAVIASDVGGAAEAVENGISGVVVPARDATQLTAAIARLCDDRSRLHELGTAARFRIEQQFTTEKMVDTIVDAYHDALHARSEN